MTQISSHRPAIDPNPGILAAVSFGLFTASLAVSAVAASGAGMISPFSATADVMASFQSNPDLVRFTSMLQFGSAVPLGICAATVYSRMLRLGARVPGPAIAFVGGITASILLMVSAVFRWTLGRPELFDDATLTHALAFLSFLTGGVGFSTGMGLLIAGLAVPMLILRLAPHWLAWTGLVIAVLAELSFLSMSIESLTVVIPIARFAGLPWLIVAGFLLPRTRSEVTRSREVVADARTD
jgi:hypothetical protein